MNHRIERRRIRLSLCAAVLFGAGGYAHSQGPAASAVPAATSSSAVAISSAAAVIPPPGTVFRDCPRCPEMVVIPPGQLLMGSPPGEIERQEDEGPVHAVSIPQPLAVGRFEITFEEWNACVADRSCPAVEESPGPASTRSRRPVVNVNHDQAQAYTEWLSERAGRRYRLLSESEWEYAARGGSEAGLSRPWGNSTTRACQFANVLDQTYRSAENDRGASFFDCEDGYAKTAPVGSFKPNGFGLYDMLGNVWEWVADCYHDSYKGAPADGSAWVAPPCKRRVNRGGCWFDRPAFVRTANRSANPSTFRDQLLGFRVARALP